MADREEVLRRFALGDEAFIDAQVLARRSRRGSAGLGDSGAALVKLGALAATDGSSLSWHQTVSDALNAGVSPDEIVDALVALAPMIGRTRVTSIAPKVALAIGYDIEEALFTR